MKSILFALKTDCVIAATLPFLALGLLAYGITAVGVWLFNLSERAAKYIDKKMNFDID